MKTIKIDLPRELDRIELHVFADEHLGDEQCDVKRLMQRIEYVKNTPCAFCILNGDIIDTRNSTVELVTKLFVNTAANLNYGGYGEAQAFKPSSKDTPVIYLDGTKKQYEARL